MNARREKEMKGKREDMNGNEKTGKEMKGKEVKGKELKGMAQKWIDMKGGEEWKEMITANNKETLGDLDVLSVLPTS